MEQQRGPQRYGVVDLHADTILWMRFAQYNIQKRHRNWVPRAPWGGHVDMPRLREGGVQVQFFGIVTLPTLGERGCAAAALDSVRIFAKEALRDDSGLVIVKTKQDLENALSEDKIAGVLALEGAHAFEGDLENLQALYEEGLRSVGLAHFTANSAAPCAYGLGSSREKLLSPFGRDIVTFCDEKGVVVDLAHCGRAAFVETCRGSKRPRIVSHTGLYGANPHWRNIDDEQLRAIAETGGVVGVIFAPQFLGRDGAEAVADHLRHGINVAGEETLALGSDFDGFIVPPSDLQGADRYPYLADVLAKKGFSSEIIGKIFGKNALRVLREVLPS